MSDTAQHLIQNGANVMAMNSEGQTPYEIINGDPEIIAKSQSILNCRIIHQVPGSAEHRYFIKLCMQYWN